MLLRGSYKTIKLCPGGKLLTRIPFNSLAKRQRSDLQRKKLQLSSIHQYTMSDPAHPHPNPRHPDYETGLTDEAVIEGHDLIQHAEEEEERVCSASNS